MDQDFRRVQRRPPKNYINQRRKRRKAIMARILAFLFLVIFIVAIVIGGIVLIKGRSISGTYVKETDVTDRIVSDITVWLSDIDDENIDPGFVKSKVEPYTINEILILSDESYTEGDFTGKKFSREIDAESYNSLVEKAYSDLDMLLNEIIKNKLVEKGYKESMTEEETAQLTQSILGMSASEYLKANGISPIPDIEQLSNELLGANNASSGAFKKSGNKITFVMNGDTKAETVIFRKGTLVFSESGRVYNEKE